MAATTRINKTFAFSTIALSAVFAEQIFAREPGTLPTIPPGATMGVPIAAPTPLDGLFLSSRSGISSQNLYDGNGDKTPTEIEIKDTVLQFALSPGKEILGGQYRAFLSIPFIDIESTNIATPFGLIDGDNTGRGSVEIRPADISWELAQGIYMNAGLSVYSPAEWDSAELVNPGQNFWTVSPSVGFSYLRNGWNASAHMLYFVNQANEDNDYESGDEAHLNLTAMKDIGNNWSVGAVGYYRQQITDDNNPNGAYGGAIAGKALQIGTGISITKQLGPINLNAMYSIEMDTENSGGGDRIWLNAIIPLTIFET